MTYHPPSKREQRRARRLSTGGSGRGLGEFIGDLFEIAVDFLFGLIR